MIKLLHEKKIKDFTNFCKAHIDGVNICTRLYAYGIDSPYQTFWYSEDDKGICLAINRSDNILTICGNITDKEEFSTFIGFTGANKIICEKNCIDYEKSENIEFSHIMEFKGTPDSSESEKLTGENIKELFDVIFENQQFNFDDWYTDISHKIRHNLIRAYGIKENDEFISSCITSGETENKAIISAVSVKEKYRHNGIGRKTVMSTINSLIKENKKIYLFTDNEITVKWYNTMGFETIGSHILITI